MLPQALALRVVSSASTITPSRPGVLHHGMAHVQAGGRLGILYAPDMDSRDARQTSSS